MQNIKKKIYIYICEWIYIIIKWLHALWLVNHLWFYCPVNSWIFCMSSELLYCMYIVTIQQSNKTVTIQQYEGRKLVCDYLSFEFWGTNNLFMFGMFVLSWPFETWVIDTNHIRSLTHIAHGECHGLLMWIVNVIHCYLFYYYSFLFFNVDKVLPFCNTPPASNS